MKYLVPSIEIQPILLVLLLVLEGTSGTIASDRDVLADDLALFPLVIA